MALALDVKKEYLVIFSLGVILAVVTEGLQTFVPSRQTDLLDGIADVCGTTLGMIFVYLVQNQGVKR